MSLRGFATRIFAPLVDRYGESFLTLKTLLPKSGIRTPFRTYLSLAFLFSSFSYIASLVLILILMQVVKISLILLITYSLFIPIVTATLTFAFFLLYPFHKALSRARNIEVNLPFVLIHMGAIAESGIPPYIIFKMIGEYEEYGQISEEMKKITRDIEEFGMDPISAIKEVAERTPNEEFKEILLGFVTTTESGGDLKLFLKNAGQQALFEWRTRREKFLQQLSAYAEFYTGLLIAAPLFLIALFAIMNLIQPTIAGFDILFLTQISIYAIVPLMNTGFLLFLRGVEVEI